MSVGKRWNARHWVALLVLGLLSSFFQFTNVLETEQGGVVHGDGVKYVFYAYNLKHHDTFSRERTFSVPQAPKLTPDKLTLPGYPWFLSHFLGEGNPDRAFLVRVELAQAALNVVSTLLAFLIALRIAPFGWAFAAGLLIATQPHLIVISDYLLTEPLFTTLLLGFVLSALHAVASPVKFLPAATAGALLGAACLVRPQFQALPWMLLLAVVLVPRLRPRLKQAALAFALFAVFVLPWQVRNSQVPLPEHEPDLLVLSLYHGTFPGFMYEDDPRTLGYPYRFDPDQAKYVQDLPATVAHVGDLFVAEPGRYARWYLLGKPGAFLSWSMVAGVGDIFIYKVTRSPFFERPSFALARAVHHGLHWPLMLGAFATMCFALWRPSAISSDPPRRTAVVFISALIAYAIVLHMFGMPLPRYNLPLKALEIALALAGMQALWAARRRREAHPAAPRHAG